MRIEYKKEYTVVYESYKWKNDELNALANMIVKTRKAEKLPVTRTVNSYRNEIKAHNRLYRLGLFRSHTKDTDLNEKQTLFEKIVWFILSR